MNDQKKHYDDSPLGQLLASFQNYISECFPEKIAEEIFEFRDLYTEIYIAVYDLKEINPEAVEKYNRLVKNILLQGTIKHEDPSQSFFRDRRDGSGCGMGGQCEWADWPAKVLEKYWPDVPRW